MTSQNRKKVSGKDAADTEASESKGEKHSRSRRARPGGQTQKWGDQVQPETSRPKGGTPTPFPIVGIGASAGGLEAFTELLKHLPLDSGMGFVLVQHLDPQHESALTQLLTRATSMPVREVTNDLRVEANHVYVIAPNTNLGMAQGVLKLQPRAAGRAAHRSIDFFFESLAQDQHECAIGVILSGTASDGTLGLEAIKAEGGITFAQDETAKYDSMLRSAIAAGCVDFVLSAENIAKELARIAKHPFVAKRAQSEPAARECPHPSEEQRTAVSGHQDGFKKILVLLRNHSTVDFSLYKTSTIQRRIQRRMVLNKLTTLDAYAQFLRGKPKELDTLYSDVLISVTSFFRNPEAFEFLKRKVFPKILPERRDEPLRVWVLGCSTGQEVYSLAMSLTEFFDNVPRAPKLQIFASDLNEALLAKARAGLYAKSVVQDVSPERLRQFFVEEDGGYRVIKPLREAIVFARQNLLSDPPFSRMNLISCRNLLIYLDSSLQKKVMPTFHYALKPKGCLFLGSSEAIGTFTNLFEQVDKKHKIYFRKPGPSPALRLQRAPKHVEVGKQFIVPKSPDAPEGFRVELNAQREADRVTRNRYAPPSVLVNAELHVLEFRGHTSPYLEPPTGQANFNVLKMAREGLMLPLRAALNKAKKENKVVRRENVRVNQNGQSRMVNFEVAPLKNLKERCYLIFFEDAEVRGVHAPRVPVETPRLDESGRVRKKSVSEALTGTRGARVLPKKEESRRVTELETDLIETRDYLQSVEEQNEAANEELQASNEEVTSANEELQSINEELETSKEELESTNEELTTVNEEMANRNTELNRLNSDLVNLQTSTHLAILLLGRDLSIRRFSAQAEKQFNLLATDVGRPISNVRHNLDLPDLETFIAEVIATVREREREVRDKDGHWYSLRVRPYFTLDNKVDGAVLVLVNIDALKQTQQEIAAARDYAANIVETVRDPMLVLDAELRVESANHSFYRSFRVESAETIGKSIFDLGNRQRDIPRLRTLLEEILPRHKLMEDFEVEHDFEQLGRRTMLLNARRIEDPTWATHRILLAIEDITEHEQHQQELQRAHLAEAVLATTRDPVLILNADLRAHAANEAFYKTFKVTSAETVGRLIYELGDCRWDMPRLRQLLEGIIPRNSFFDDLEVACEIEQVGRRTFLLYARLLPDEDAKRILLGIQDISEILHFQTELRQSETRKDAILTSALDAIITMDHEGKFVEFNPAAEKIFGYSRAEVLGKPMAELIIPARLRERHYQGLPRYLATGEGPVLNRQIEMPALRADRTEFPAELAIVAIRGTQPPMFTCFLRDISERKRTERRLAAIHAVTRILAEAPALSSAIPKVLQTFGESLGWEVGDLWTLDSESNVLRCLNVWHVPSAKIDSFKTCSSAATFTRDNSLPGRVWGSLKPAWIPDIAKDGNFLRSSEALAAGLRAAFAFPILSGEKFLGVMEFFSPEFREPDEALLDTFSGIGSQIGQFLERKRVEEALRQSEERLRLLVEGSPNAMVMTDEAGLMTLVNSQAERVFGYTRDELLGQPVEMLVPERYRAKHPTLRAGFLQAPMARPMGAGRDLFGLRKEGTEVPVEIGLSPLQMGERTFVLVTVTDITERKQAEEALGQAQALLADRASQLEGAVAERTAELRETVTELEAFSYSVSHDMRAPLRAMQGYAKALLNDYKDRLDSEALHYLERIVRGSNRLDLLIQDVLAYSRVAKGEITLHPVDLERLIDDLLPIHPEFQPPQARIAVEKPLHLVSGHEAYLTQCVTNLLGNAVKFMPSGVIPEIRIRTERLDGKVRLWFEDNGIGIDPSHHEQIFQIFGQVYAEKKYGGTGIGLAIVRKAVQRMGGETGVESELGTGGRFWIILGEGKA